MVESPERGSNDIATADADGRIHAHPPDDPLGITSTLVVALVYIVFVAVVWAVADRTVRSERIDEAVGQVERVRDIELRTVGEWAEAQLDDARYFADDPDVVDAVGALLDSEDLTDDPAQRALRNRLTPFLELNGLAGYFVVRPDGLSLASSRDVNIDTPNLVAIDHPDAFAAIIDGTAQVTPPQVSDVPLDEVLLPGTETSRAGRLPETMFAGAPVVVDGDVVAAFMFRVVPGSDLTTLLTDLNPDDGLERIVFSDSGVAVTASTAVEPLDPVVVDGRPASTLFDGGDEDNVNSGGTNVESGAGSAPDRLDAWAISPRLGLGVLTTYDSDVALRPLRSERLTLVAVALLTMAIGIGVISLAHYLAARARTRRIELSERRFRSLVDPAPDPILRVRPDGRILAANPALTRMLGIGPPVDDGARRSRRARRRRSDEERVTTIDDLGERHPALAALAERWPIVARITGPADIDRLEIHVPGEPVRFVRVRLVPIVAGAEDSEVLVIITDITEHVEREQSLETLALTDPLTGLPNRAAIADRLQVALARLRRPYEHGGIAAMVIDLDHFKTINDAFGHAAGDRVLRAVGVGLATELRGNDSIGRIGGDEFTVVCEAVADLDAADDLGRRLSERLNAIRVDVGDSTVAVGGTIGVAWTDRPLDPAELVHRADRAMLQAKRQRDGDRHAVARPADDSPSGWSSVLPRDLFGALDRREFVLHYQPIVDADGRVGAVEALLRWNHPDHGLIAPGRFLAALMESGFIGPVGRWGVATAIEQARRWAEDGFELTVHVNVSPVELSSGVIDTIDDALGRTGLDPATLCVEVTEHAFNGNMLTAGSVARLGELGVEIALDDFGTGASSLMYLRQEPLHLIKLDRSFVASIDLDTATAAKDRPILRSIIGLAQELELDLVAEGVETVEQRDWLVDAGCEAFQGWAFSEAVPANEFDPTATLSSLPDRRLQLDP